MSDGSKPGEPRSANLIANEAVWTPEAVAAFWDYHGQKDPPGGYFSEVLAEGILNAARWTGHLKPAARVVDFGCGRGPLIEALVRHGHSAAGVEFSTDSATLVNQRFAGNGRYLGTQVVGHAAPRGDEQFETAFCIEVIEHLTDEFLESTFLALASLVRQGGSVLITTPFDEKLASHQVFCPFCRTEFHHMQHVRSWNVASLTAALNHAGFDVAICQPVQLARFCYGQPKGRRDRLISSTRSLVRGTLAALSTSAAFHYAARRPGDNLLAIGVKR